MNAVTKTASTKSILAIDLGKYKSVACACTELTGSLRFASFEPTLSEMHPSRSTGK